MKLLHSHFSKLVILALVASAGLRVSGQDTTKKDLIVNIGFYTLDNHAAYLAVHAKTKVEGRFQPVKGVAFRLYLDKDSAAYLTGYVITDPGGEGRTLLSPALKDQWNGSATHVFIALSDGDAAFNPSRTQTPITKAHLKIDTGEGRTITATVLESKNGEWLPAKGVDVKVDISRSGGDLAIGDKESFTTDSAGKVVAEFKRDGLPGDKNGVLILLAKVEDNDLYGNLKTEMAVSWGSVAKPGFRIDHRTLWGVRSETPLWLLFMAYSIFFSVWAVLVYLIVQVWRIKKAGRPSETAIS